jgi:hypothetical protein
MKISSLLKINFPKSAQILKSRRIEEWQRLFYSCLFHCHCHNMKVSFYEELERVFVQFLKYHMIIPLGDFNAKARRKDIFEPTIGNDSLPEISKLCHIQ